MVLGAVGELAGGVGGSWLSSLIIDFTHVVSRVIAAQGVRLVMLSSSTVAGTVPKSAEGLRIDSLTPTSAEGVGGAGIHLLGEHPTPLS